MGTKLVIEACRKFINCTKKSGKFNWFSINFTIVLRAPESNRGMKKALELFYMNKKHEYPELMR